MAPRHRQDVAEAWWQGEQPLSHGHLRPEVIHELHRITVDPAQCGGRPCVRGLRIRVTDVLDLLAAGLTPDQILEELPDLEREDVAGCLRFASRRIDHPIVAA